MVGLHPTFWPKGNLRRDSVFWWTRLGNSVVSAEYAEHHIGAIGTNIGRCFGQNLTLSLHLVDHPVESFVAGAVVSWPLDKQWIEVSPSDQTATTKGGHYNSGCPTLCCSSERGSTSKSAFGILHSRKLYRSISNLVLCVCAQLGFTALCGENYAVSLTKFHAFTSQEFLRLL